MFLHSLNHSFAFTFSSMANWMGLFFCSIQCNSIAQSKPLFKNVWKCKSLRHTFYARKHAQSQQECAIFKHWLVLPSIHTNFRWIWGYFLCVARIAYVMHEHSKGELSHNIYSQPLFSSLGICDSNETISICCWKLCFHRNSLHKYFVSLASIY